MNQKFHLTIAALLAVVLVLTAAGAWAAPKFMGTGPVIPQGGGGDDGVINMGAATFDLANCPGCVVNVTTIDDPSTKAAAPEGKQFLGPAFDMTLEGTGSVKICFALPPGTNATIYKLDTSKTPAVWVEVPGVVVNVGGIVCADVAESGTYSLIATP